tara:strand:- start:370 stop:816 length:447 start_codon:yes stop_codon:yes gene_type:complete
MLRKALQTKRQIIEELNRRLDEQSGFVDKQQPSDTLKKFNKRQGIEEEELGGMTSDPRIMKKEYGNPDDDGMHKMPDGTMMKDSEMQTKEINREEIIKILNQIHTLQHEDAPAIAQRRLEELFEKVGIGTDLIAGVDFSDDLRRLDEL